MNKKTIALIIVAVVYFSIVIFAFCNAAEARQMTIEDVATVTHINYETRLAVAKTGEGQILCFEFGKDPIRIGDFCSPLSYQFNGWNTGVERIVFAPPRAAKVDYKKADVYIHFVFDNMAEFAEALRQMNRESN